MTSFHHPGMKKTLWKVLSFIFGVLLFLAWIKDQDHSQMTKGHLKMKTLQVIEDRIQSEKENINNLDHISLGATASGLGGMQQVLPPQKKCWEKIREQYQESPHFIVENRQRLRAVVGEWFYVKDNAERVESTDETSLPGMFFLALAKAGLLDGLKMQTNEQQALALLQRVSEADPGNSAPLLYAAIIEGRMGNRAHRDELLSELSKTLYFDSYLKDFTYALYSGVRSPSDLLVAQQIWSTVPVPNYLALKDLVKEASQFRIAEQLIRDGLRLDRERSEDLSWIPIEYELGKKLLDSFGKGKGLPEFQALLRQNPDTLGASAKLDATCDLESIHDEVERLQKYLDVNWKQ